MILGIGPFKFKMICVFFGGQVDHGDVNVDYEVYSIFSESIFYWFHKWLFSGVYFMRGVGGVFNEFPRGVNSNGGHYNFVLNWRTIYMVKLNLHTFGGDFFNCWLDHGLVEIKVDTYLFIYITVVFGICVWLFILGMFTI